MADALSFLTSSEQIQANYEKYKDRFKDANEELVNSETFLNLLVAEMTNQDPLEPTSNTEFVTQMAQFTSLQYAQDSSEYAQANYASSLVGKTVIASKMEGSELVTKTGVVEKVVKTDGDYTLTVDGTTFKLSNINSVIADKDTPADTDKDESISKPVTSVNALGDTIARASMMIGMNATIPTDKAMVSGIIESIKVKNGEVNVVINGESYSLSDIIEVKYPEIVNVQPDYGTVPDNGSGDAAAEQLMEMLEQLSADDTIGEDIQDLADIPDII